VTRIDFHSNAPDKAQHACRWLRKAVLDMGAQVVVTGEGTTLDDIDRRLWQLSPADFVAHCRADADPQVLQRSPVVLGLPGGTALSTHSLLLNVGAEVPAGFERFERMVELVGADPADVQAGRARWRHYKQRGYAMSNLDLASRAAS